MRNYVNLFAIASKTCAQFSACRRKALRDAVTTETSRKRQGSSPCACVLFSNTHYFLCFYWALFLFSSLNARCSSFFRSGIPYCQLKDCRVGRTRPPRNDTSGGFASFRKEIQTCDDVKRRFPQENPSSLSLRGAERRGNL